MPDRNFGRQGSDHDASSHAGRRVSGPAPSHATSHHALRALRADPDRLPMNAPSQPPSDKPDGTPPTSRPGLPAVALVASVAAHVGLFWTLVNSEPPFTPRLPHPPPTLVQLTPPPEPEPEPPPPEPEAPPEVTPEAAPQQAKPPPRSQQAPRATEAKPAPEQPPSPVAPIALSGLTLSNAEFSVPTGSPGPSGSGPTRAPAPAAPAAKPSPTPKPSQPALVPLSDLSSKPKPPSLDAALRRHYPAALRARGIEGQALVRLTLAPAGTVRSVSVLSESEPGFGAACKQTLVGSRWSAPLDQTGKPVGTQVTYRCRFRVQ